MPKQPRKRGRETESNELEPHRSQTEMHRRDSSDLYLQLIHALFIFFPVNAFPRNQTHGISITSTILEESKQKNLHLFRHLQPFSQFIRYSLENANKI